MKSATTATRARAFGPVTLPWPHLVSRLVTLQSSCGRIGSANNLVGRPMRRQNRFTDEEVTTGLELRHAKTPAKGVTLLFYRGFPPQRLQGVNQAAQAASRQLLGPGPNASSSSGHAKTKLPPLWAPVHVSTATILCIVEGDKPQTLPFASIQLASQSCYVHSKQGAAAENFPLAET